MRYISPLIVILLVVMSAASYAADARLAIRGTVHEKGSRRPLDGVTIFVAGNDSHAATSEPDGSFVLEVAEPGEYALIAAAIGYVKSAPLMVVIGLSGEHDTSEIYLEPVYSISEVVVQAERNRDRVAKTVVTGKELATVPGTAGDPLRAIQALPGMTSSSDSSSSPAIRGSGPDNNAYYVDFLPVGYLFHMGGMESVINADLVEDFNIYSSSFGPEYMDVTGGVIDVRLRKPRTDRIGVKVNLSILEADLLIEGPVSSSQSLYLAARRSYYDLLLSKTGTLDTGIKYKQFPQYYDYQGKYLWQISPDSTLTLMASGAGDEMKLSLTNESDTAKHDPIFVGDYQMKVGYHSQGLLLTSRITPNIANRFGFAHMSTDLQQQMTQLGHVKVIDNTYYFRDHLTLQASERHELLVGVESGLSRWKLDLNTAKAMSSEFTTQPDYTSSAWFTNYDTISSQWVDLAIKERWRFTDQAILIVGAHGSYESYFEKYRAEPRVGLEVTPLKGTLLTAAWGKYHQFPQGYQVVNGIGNPNLSYELADHYSVGLEQQLPEGWSVKLEGYFKQFSDLVIPHDPENYINGGSGTAYGAEMLVKKSRTGDWSGWISAAYTKTLRHNDVTGEAFPYSYDQPLVVNLVYDWKFAKRWTFGSKWRYQTGSPYTPVIGSYTDSTGRIRPLYGALGSERLPDYHRLDIRISREFLFDRWKMSAYLDIINAYANQNVSGYEYSSDYSTRKKVTQLPFLPAIGIMGEF